MRMRLRLDAAWWARRTASLRASYRNVRNATGLVAATAYDALGYARGSALLRNREHEALKSLIVKSYHRLEKGLALAAPRPGFGTDAVDQLTKDLSAYLDRHGADRVTTIALQVLDQYAAFCRCNGVDTQDICERTAALRRRTAGLPPGAQARDATPVEQPLGGTVPVASQAVLNAARVPFGDFVRHRYSVRQFAPRPVDRGLIEEAVRDAQYSPSVCNRESVQVLWVDDAPRARELLAFQNGNRGFGDSAGALLVVTVRQAAFHTVGERYQAWIDGGLFAMTLVYALHAQGLGSCCLNWSVEPGVDRAFKRAAGLPAHDRVIMLLAVGHLPEHFAVARSARRPLNEVLRCLNDESGAPENPT
jgi:nitroreductase